MRLDGDAAFLLEVHGIEQLRLHVARGDGAGAMQQAVGKRRLPMINMGNDAEIANMRCVHCLKSERSRITGKRVKKRKFPCPLPREEDFTCHAFWLFGSPSGKSSRANFQGDGERFSFSVGRRPG